MRIQSLAAVAILLATTGCGPGNGLSLARVSGKVTYKGEPVTFGTILFEPEKSDAPPAAGSIGKDGSFVLSTEDPGDGAVVGTHRVAIIGLEELAEADQAAMPDPEKSPQEYMMAKTKAGTTPVRSKKADDSTYTDKSGKVFRITVPTRLNQTSTSDLKVDVSSGSNRVEIAIDEDGKVQVKS
ncbi:hypothetical protein [Planctomyces sp. SH-PL62]|uniref:hypothetical protein n=1 Tax=Planctomyces sp. SH-PL62 TaxID=1636152 RepID=UPI00078D7EFA|nr:hypothetical protein [Planctomyces sp. SH-PL62]AMV40088.1 hypothetical protein VT85_21830 [Planctomyces sp. SH-PL62]